jgi:hypothetical protein
MSLDHLRPGDVIRCWKPMVSFFPENHPHATTQHGPLIPREAQLYYVGAFAGRENLHLARTARQPTADDGFIVPFKEEDLVPELREG